MEVVSSSSAIDGVGSGSVWYSQGFIGKRFLVEGRGSMLAEVGVTAVDTNATSANE
jgi:hypothetical protein